MTIESIYSTWAITMNSSTTVDIMDNQVITLAYNWTIINNQVLNFTTTSEASYLIYDWGIEYSINWKIYNIRVPNTYIYIGSYNKQQY